MPGAEKSEGDRTPEEVLAVPRTMTAVDRSVGARVTELVRGHAPALARLFRYLGVPSRDVEDALQDVFLVAHRRLADAREVVDRPDAWLRGVALNVARNRRRALRRSRLTFVEDAPEVADARTPESEVDVERQRQRLLRLLDALPEEHRMALVLFEIDGRPMKEVAALIGCALPTAYKYVSAAQARLKDAVGREDGDS